jgi:hypothetical protein
MKTQITHSLAVAALGLMTSISTTVAQPLDLKFVFHLDAGMAEQDVFVEKSAGQIHRVTAADTNMAAPLYAATGAVHHNPFNAATNGPYDKGSDLSLTLGKWLAASGQGTYECQGDVSSISIAFDNLVPDGLYTMWHFFMPMPANQPFGGTIDVPYGSRDGSQAAFSADAAGAAEFQQTTDGCLQLSGTQTMAGLAIAYHSDGEVHGGHPGDFSLNSHVQLFTMLPKSAQE